jgi:hypothetical protein
MDLAWGQRLWRKVYHTRYTMKVVSPDSYEYTDESGESENSMKVFVSGKETRIASVRPANSQPAQAGATPLLLEKDEGESRLWRPEPGEADIGGLILKITPKAKGSEHLVLVGGEDMRPPAMLYRPISILSRMRSWLSRKEPSTLMLEIRSAICMPE